MVLEFLVLVSLLVGTEKYIPKSYDIEITGEIRDLSGQEQKLISLVRSGQKQVRVKLDSPGGGLHTSIQFIEAMIFAKNLGTDVVCVVDGEAYSAALVILSVCDQRYALYGSRVMFHTARATGMAVGQFEALQLYAQLSQINEAIWTPVRAVLPPEYFQANFMAERLIPASEIEAVSGGRLLKVIKSLAEIKK